MLGVSAPTESKTADSRIATVYFRSRIHPLTRAIIAFVANERNSNNETDVVSFGFGEGGRNLPSADGIRCIMVAVKQFKLSTYISSESE